MFPDCLKVAEVSTVYKSGEKSELCYHRPTFIFSSISEVLEKFIYVRSTTFLISIPFSQLTQYKFKANHSTMHALLDVITFYDNINNNKFTALVLLDLRKVLEKISEKPLDLLVNSVARLQ